jgi:hypothetical protein
MERVRRISTVLSRSLSTVRSSSLEGAAAQVDAALRRQMLRGAPPAAAALVDAALRRQMLRGAPPAAAARAGASRELAQLAALGLAMGFATGQDAAKPVRYAELDALQKHNVRKAALEAPRALLRPFGDDTATPCPPVAAAGVAA